jgi:hypothetical protein
VTQFVSLEAFCVTFFKWVWCLRFCQSPNWFYALPMATPQCLVMAEKWIFYTYILLRFRFIIIKEWRIGFRLMILAKLNCLWWIVRSELINLEFSKQVQSNLHIKISLQVNITRKVERSSKKLQNASHYRYWRDEFSTYCSELFGHRGLIWCTATPTQPVNCKLRRQWIQNVESDMKSSQRPTSQWFQGCMAWGLGYPKW